MFASGRYASDWDHAGRPIAWSEWTDDDLRRMAENDAEIRRTGQPIPYVRPSHDAEPVPGQLGPLRFAAGKLWAAIERCADWLADQVRSGVRPWRSAEIMRDARAANYVGVEGPVFKGLALLNTHPRVKTLDSHVYAESYAEMFEEAASADSVFVSFAEARPKEGSMQLTADQTLAALKALGGDQKLLEKLLAAIAETGGSEPAAAPAPMADPAAPAKPEEKPAVAPMSDAAAPKPEEEKPAAMSDAAARLAKLEADNALLRQRVDEQRSQREADVALARTQRVVAFADSVSRTHGQAIAAKAKASVEARLTLLPKTENFADGKDLLAEVFAEITGLIGEPRQRTDPTAARGGGVDTFSEDKAREEIFAEATPRDRAYLESPQGAATLKAAIQLKREEASF